MFSCKLHGHLHAFGELPLGHLIRQNKTSSTQSLSARDGFRKNNRIQLDATNESYTSNGVETSNQESMETDDIVEYALDASIYPLSINQTIDIASPVDFSMESLGSFDVNNPFMDLELEMMEMVSPLLYTPFAPLSFDEREQTEELEHQRLPLQNQPEVSNTTEVSNFSEQASELKQLLLTKPTTPFIPALPEKSISKSSKCSITNNSSPKVDPPTRRKSSRQSSQKTQTDTKYNTRVSRTPSHDRPLRDKPLKFPPCFVCGGRASGLHYGVNSCEACKGFFRRYIIRNEEYKCMKDGNCQVVNRNRENCSGCRLKKCLDLGMSKENSKLGRYTLSRRTETIRKVNELKNQNQAFDSSEESRSPESGGILDPHSTDHTYFGTNQMSPTFSGPIKSISIPETFPDTLIDELTNAMSQIRPYGPSILTEGQLQNVIKYHYDRYQNKIKLYGQMNSVPKDEYYKLLKEYGIDIDGRLSVLRQYVLEIQRVTGKYCEFAKKIPGINKLSPRDQSNLLKAARVGIFIILMHEGYNHEYQVLISRNGNAYHLEEIADKCFSRRLLRSICAMYVRWQKLRISPEEKALAMAITLTFSDRCKLEEPSRLDDLQVSLTLLLRRHLDRVHTTGAFSRFTKIIDCLTDMRTSSDMYLDEYKQLCDDKTLVENVPQLPELLVEEW